MREEKNVIIAGDFNCRIDKPNNKTSTMLDILQEEGFRLINKAEEITYIAYNGTSTIDLVFYRGKDITVKNQQRKLYTSTTPLTKHIPIHTSILLTRNYEEKSNTDTHRISRKLDLEALKSNTQALESMKRHLRDNNINLTLTTIQDALKLATVPAKQRKAKPWFDTECYQHRRVTLDTLHKARLKNSRTNLEEYAKIRKEYKRLLKNKKAQFIEKQALLEAEEACKDPFIAIRRKTTRAPGEIQMERWENHFTQILNKTQTNTSHDIKIPIEIENVTLFTTEEVQTAIRSAKNKKAAGPDGIYNEMLKESVDLLVEIWTDLFNRCLTTGKTPENWKKSTIKVLYKGKGDTDNPNSYRGIALESNIFKIYSKLLNRRLTESIDPLIPNQQFGFREGRSTLHAVSNLLNDIEQALRHSKGKLHTVFIDYTKAFDLMNRTKLIEKLESMTKGGNEVTTAIRNILAYNVIEIKDGVATSREILQTNGVLQGDPMSPTLFNIATADVTKILENYNSVSLYMYADDMVLNSTNRHELQEVLNKLYTWAEENEFIMNHEKTVYMVFRKGGRLAREDKVTLGGQELELVNSYRYLGINLQTTSNSFRIHIKERVSAAIRGMYDIKNITRLSMHTAMILFHAKITPMLSYGIELIWDKLTLSDLTTLEKVKARYLKRALGVAKTAPSRLVYELARESFYIEDLRIKLLLPSTDQANKLIEIRKKKREEITEDFYTTDAMVDRRWTKENQDLRNVLTRLAIHGFHFKICENRKFHEPNNECICVLCKKHCEKYHLSFCGKRVRSIVDYSKD